MDEPITVPTATYAPVPITCVLSLLSSWCHSSQWEKALIANSVVKIYF